MDTNPIVQKFTNFAFKLASIPFLQALRDAFAIVMPLFILAGLGTLFNSVFFPWFAEGATLAKLQYWSTAIGNATLNISGLLIAAVIAYCVARQKKYNNPIAVLIVSVASLFAIMPLVINMKPIDAETAVALKGAVMYSNLGTQSMFAGIIIGLTAPEIFIRLSKIKQFEINLGENIPPQVGKSFTSLIPTMLTVAFFALISALLLIFLDMDLISVITTVIQEPLRKVNTSIVGFILLYSLGNFLFTLGIHQGVIMNSILEPFLIPNINDNMLAFSAGTEPPHILTKPFVTVFAQMGGSGVTISLLIAIFLFSKSKFTRSVASLSLAPGIFNINEPIIFGLPVVFNLPMMIPFVALPAIFSVVGYVLTSIGWVSKTVVFIPWMTPPLISGYLATGGDWRAVVIQIILIIIGVLVYIPFLKISDSLQEKTSIAAQEDIAQQ